MNKLLLEDTGLVFGRIKGTKVPDIFKDVIITKPKITVIVDKRGQRVPRPAVKVEPIV